MPIENFEIVGSYNNQRFPNIDAERTINMFEYIDLKGKKPKSLISTSGLQNTNLEFTGSTGGFRAEFVLNEFEYFVVGSDIWRRDQFNVLTKLNSTPIATTSGYVGVDANNNSNGEQILFVDGIRGYVWDTGTNQFTPNLALVDPAFPVAPVDVCFLDGFLVVANAGSQTSQIPTNTFQLSALNNVYSWGLVANTFTADPGPGPFADTLIVSTVMPTGMQFQITVTGVIPPPLVAATTYYAIFVDSTHIRVATSFTNALSNTFINITGTGTPPNTITNGGIMASLTQAFAPGQLQLGAINSHPGDIVACRTLHRRIFFFSTNYTEVWENAGIGTNLPFRRNNGLLMEYGTPSRASIVTGFDMLIFLSQDRDGLGAVMQVTGTESIPISNRALDFQLAQYAQAGQISDSRGIFIKENGIIFYRLNFTAANHTFVYDVTLSNPQTEEGKLWHEEETLHGNRHPAQTHGYFFGNNYYGSFDQPVLYQVDQSFVTNDGEDIPRIRIGRSYVPSTYNRTRIDRFMLDIIQGQPVILNLSNILNLLTEDGNIIDTENDLDLILETSTITPVYDLSQPPVFLSYSKDGGVTFGYRQAATMGALGERKHRTIWRKLGVVPRGQGFVPKIEFFSEVPFIVLGAAWFYEVLPE
jgi:hypothetical protein